MIDSVSLYNSLATGPDISTTATSRHATIEKIFPKIIRKDEALHVFGIHEWPYFKHYVYYPHPRFLFTN